VCSSDLIEPGDILVLVRKRDAFAAALAKELKTRRGIPVAGVDRLVLSSHIAIQDLLSVGRFVTLGADDLAIAELVKSPLFNLGEDDLFTLAALRTETQTLWQRLEELAGTDPSWQSVHDRLKRWRQLGRSLRPHDFYATLLGAEGGRRAFLARFGHEVSDVLDEFLNFALAHEQAGLPGLTGFVSTMERDSPEIKREQDKGRNDVRIMTVHASKGLEAPVVFLVDGGSKPFDKTLLPQLRLFAAPSSPLPIPAWLPKKEYQNRLSSDDDDRLRQAAEEEYRRLLYVGMTRASDKLIVCGYRKKRETEGTWAKLVQAALAADDKRCQPADYVFGALSWSGYRWRHHEEATSAPAEKSSAGETPKPLPPQELHAALPPAPRLPRPLAPSGAHAMIDDEEGDRIVGSALFDAASHSRMPDIRGKIMHRLLQKLPEKPRAEWQEAAGLYVERALPLWQPEERGTLIAGVLAILEEDAYIHLFGPESRAEVSLMGTIELGGKPFSVTGRIDRLGVHDDRVFVLDYKTNRQPPADQAQIPFAHRAQLALYRKLLEPLYPGKSIECLLLYTEGPDLYSLTDADVEKALLDLSAK
jgi:ATP-dependent helicase/nuclease subunit A